MQGVAEFEVKAVWDPQSQMWVATSEDIIGLSTEAPTLDALQAKLEVMIPELVALNGLVPKTAQPVPVRVVTEGRIVASAA